MVTKGSRDSSSKKLVSTKTRARCHADGSTFSVLLTDSAGGIMVTRAVGFEGVAFCYA